jgi:OmpA-OmpF porin, OOP family
VPVFLLIVDVDRKEHIMRTRWTLICALTAASSLAHAADETGKWYLNPQAGYLWADSDRGVDDDYYYGLGVGKHVSPEWSVELNGTTGSYDGVSTGDLDITAFSVDALRVFRRAETISPFLSVGVGYIDDDPSVGSSEGSPLAQVGAGLLIDVAENSTHSFVFQLRPEVKARWDFIDEGSNDRFLDYMAGIGFQFAFGAPRRVEAPKPAPTPAPAPAAAPPPPSPPKDTDGDGVLDPSDQCPDTPRGTAVDAVGCPRKGSITLQGVTFEFNSAKLTADSRPLLNDVAADLKKYPRLKVELQGHTDSVGADAYNLRLSQQRADAVREYLTSQGVAADQLTSKGYGETQPTGDNSTEAGRADNRRVAMRVGDNPGDVEVKGAERN